MRPAWTSASPSRRRTPIVREVDALLGDEVRLAAMGAQAERDRHAVVTDRLLVGQPGDAHVTGDDRQFRGMLTRVLARCQ